MLNDRAEAVLAALGGEDPVPAGSVAATIASHGPNLGARLLERVVPDDPWPDLVSPAGVADRAEAEAARLGSLRVGCEHLVLALYALTRGAQLGPVRAAVQEMAAERAHAGYLALEPRLPEPARAPVVVVFAGLPGSGKSTLAEETGIALRAPVFSLDWLLGSLTPFGLVRGDNAAALGDQLVRAAVARQLQLGLDVVADTAGHQQENRDRMRELVTGLGGALVEVECLCSDEVVHRARVESRSRSIPGWPGTVTWEHVERMRASWCPWTPHLTLDTTTPIPTCMAQVHQAVSSAR
ncbi:AAA family ATPase [Streptomyces sp. CA-111067]|uniref:AAA family ATPase n=1 Tax=Streptomyces sp. CA-111067 TaxID=3240046 RepID=UPI003D981FBD